MPTSLPGLSKVDGATLVQRLDQAGIAYGRLNEVSGLSEHPQLRRIEVATPHGPAHIPAPPAIRDGAAASLGAVPALGRHTDALRAEFAV